MSRPIDTPSFCLAVGTYPFPFGLAAKGQTAWIDPVDAAPWNPPVLRCKGFCPGNRCLLRCAGEHD